MKVTVLGSSGSIGGPDNPASGYLVTTDSGAQIVMDLGPGSLANLQQHTNPSECDLIFSHLHPDHVLDVPSLLVWRRYHPSLSATRRATVWAPEDFARRIGRLDSDDPSKIGDVEDTLDIQVLTPGRSFTLGGARITALPAVHPIEAYCFRIEADGTVLSYSGDSASCEQLIQCAREADIFLAEATWGADTSNQVGDVAPMHMTGEEVGAIAQKAGVKHLVLTHIPPWGDVEETLHAAREKFSGPLSYARPHQEILVE